MKKLLLLFSLAIGMNAYTQVAINADGSLPDNSAVLDVVSTTKGILLPRMTLTQRNSIAIPATGLMIYQTDNSPGYYYNSGTSGSPAWVIAGTGSGWGLNGNSGTNPAANFIGTTDPQPLIFKVNNQKAGNIDYTIPYNTCFGYQSLNLNTGAYNSTFGYQALMSNISGFGNTANGFKVLYSNTTGINNTADGVQSLFLNTTGSWNTANGALALYSNTAGYYNTANGFQALVFNTSGIGNTANGANALNSNTTGNYNTANGFQTLFFNTTGNHNTADGDWALTSNTTGNFNTANGSEALFSNTTGDYNTANGSKALYFNITGNNNTANGVNALYWNSTGNYNTAIGNLASYYNNGAYNTAVGFQASQTNTSGFQNTSLGANSLVNNSTGSYHTAVGYNTGPNSTSYMNTTCIGTDATATATDMARIGNVFVNSIGGQVGWTTLSDGRFKVNVKEDVPGLAFITQLRPVSYQIDRESVNDFTGLNARKREQSTENVDMTSAYTTEPISPATTGFIAQEVEVAAKNIGFDFSGVDAPENENDMYGLRYAEFVVPLVKAVQEQQQQIEELKAENAELKEQMMAIQKELSAK